MATKISSTKKSPEKIIFTDDLERMKKRSLVYLHSGYHLHFTGPSGIGKTSLALNIANEFDQPVMFMNGRQDLSPFDLLGGFSGYKSSKTVDNFVRTVYKQAEEFMPRSVPGRLTEAVKNGYIVIYDEFTRSTPEINNLFLSILEEGILPIYGTDEKVNYLHVHEDFKIIFTSNPEEYAGVFPSQDALVDRMITLHMDYPDTDTEARLISEITDISMESAGKIAKLTSAVRKKCQDKSGQSPSLRASLTLARISRDYDIETDESDEDFIALATDVLGPFLYRSLKNERFEKIRRLIVQEVKKI
ncbi:gas vesicle protein GvpN [Evansella clarkii]|uniref:gas vesicle protein GvpN n=1 Tax=Evansella clarkii TaxID=79879 RepID=UPI000B4536F0|nr:gas vesicle protein GvpN [Evansella clarkii]